MYNEQIGTLCDYVWGERDGQARPPSRGVDGIGSVQGVTTALGHGPARQLAGGQDHDVAASALTVVLADEHALVRAGVRSLLARLDGIVVAGETGDGREALRLVEKLRPDVLLVSIDLPGLNGLEVAARVGSSRAATRVIVLSRHSGEAYVRAALDAGAAGYLLKDSRVTELERALRTVAGGRMYLTPAVSPGVVAEHPRRADARAPAARRITPRQREVLQLIAEGHSTRAIAHELSLSVKTIESHRAQLMERLGIRDVAGLVRYAIRTGLVDPER